MYPKLKEGRILYSKPPAGTRHVKPSMKTPFHYGDRCPRCAGLAYTVGGFSGDIPRYGRGGMMGMEGVDIEFLHCFECGLEWSE